MDVGDDKCVITWLVNNFSKTHGQNMTDNNNNNKKRERFFSSFLDAGVLASGCGSVAVTTLLGKPVTEEPILTKNKNK